MRVPIHPTDIQKVAFFGLSPSNMNLMGMMDEDESIFVFGSFARHLLMRNFGEIEGLSEMDILKIHGDGINRNWDKLGITCSNVRDAKLHGETFEAKYDFIGNKTVHLMEIKIHEGLVAEDLIFASTFAHERLYVHKGAFHYDKKLFNSLNHLRDEIQNKVARMPPLHHRSDLLFNSDRGRMMHAMKLAQRGWTLKALWFRPGWDNPVALDSGFPSQDNPDPSAASPHWTRPRELACSKVARRILGVCTSPVAASPERLEYLERILES